MTTPFPLEGAEEKSNYKLINIEATWKVMEKMSWSRVYANRKRVAARKQQHRQERRAEEEEDAQSETTTVASRSSSSSSPTPKTRNEFCNCNGKCNHLGRCTCLQLGKECSELCRCRGCDNCGPDAAKAVAKMLQEARSEVFCVCRRGCSMLYCMCRKLGVNCNARCHPKILSCQNMEPRLVSG